MTFAAVVILGVFPVFASPESTAVFFPDFDTFAAWQDFDDLPEPVTLVPVAVLAAAASSDSVPEIPRNLRNNRYFTESLRLANLAQLSYDAGDYDTSSNYAEEAVRYARLSDEYIALQLKIRETNNAIAAAKKRLDWARSVNAESRYPKEYGEAQQYYDASLKFRGAEDWDEAIDAAKRVIQALAYVREPGETPPPPPPPPPPAPPAPPPVTASLPAQYTVRSWNSFRDCFWNIAGYPWAYGDPRQWRLIYEANRAKLPQPDNPNLVHPGTVLDIPSIRGEARQGMWDEKTDYSSAR
jgi:tetratricopeptide (TPR) repeat protein